MIIIGKGGFAREVQTYTGRRTVMVVSDDFRDAKITEIPAVIGIGDGTVREKIVEENPKTNWGIVDKSTSWGDYQVGEGSIICPGTIITTDVKIGDHVIINLNCTIGHDSTIDDYTTVSPGVNISGNVKIGKKCYIGSNAVIREKITICDNVIIGAGAVVVKDILESGTYVGNPIKRIK